MDKSNPNPREPIDGEVVSAPVKLKFGVVSLILGVVGFIMSWGSLLLIFLIMGAAGGLDLMGGDVPIEWLIYSVYLGFSLGITGGILGTLSLARKENKGTAIISVGLGVLMLCACTAITYLIVQLYIWSLPLR
jgi:hypothetical protein